MAAVQRIGTCSQGYKRLIYSRMRKLLRDLAAAHNAPEQLSALVPRVVMPKPRNVTVTSADAARLYDNARMPLRAMLLMCSDLAIRSGTANRLTLDCYNEDTRCFVFVTKFQDAQTMPVTEELADMLELIKDAPRNVPIVALLNRLDRRWCRSKTPTLNALRKEFRRLKKRLGINRSYTFHDFRRTTAVNVYKTTGDVRDVQAVLGHRHLSSTVIYLDHDLNPVTRDLLERAKRYAAKEKSA